MSYVIAFSGSHGTGKTVSAAQKFIDLKINHPDKSIKLLHDLEAQSPYPINQDSSQYSQEWLFANHINKELEALSRFDIVVTDRTIVDVIGYTYALGFHSLAADMLCMAGSHMYVYREIYFKHISFNSYCYDDGIRAVDDPAFRREVEDSMLIQYEHLISAVNFHGEIFYN